MNRLLHETCKLSLGASLAFALAACGGGGGGGEESATGLVDQALSGVLNFMSDGAFKDLDSLVAVLEGDQLLIKDFGTSLIGTNPSVVPLNSPLVRDVTCADSSCTGQVLVPSIVNGKIQGFVRESGTITRQGTDSIVINSPSMIGHVFTKIAVPTPEPSPSTGDTQTPPPAGTTTDLGKSATCAQWWAAIGNRTLTFVTANNSYVPLDVAGIKLRMTGDANATVKRYAFDGRALPVPNSGNPPIDYLAGRTGELRLADEWPFQRRCRFYLSFDPQWIGYTYSEYVLFADSLRNGRMAFSGNGENEALNKETWVLTVD